MLVGLIHDDPGWQPEPAPEPARRRLRWVWAHGHWRALAWWAGWCWLFVLAGIVANLVGALAGYLVVLVAVALASWRVERWCARQYWGGLREWHG